MVRIIKDNLAGKDGFFTRQLNSYLTKKASFEYPRNRVIRPSEITDCTRQIVCKLLGFSVKENITPRLQRIFDNGNYVHTRYLKSYVSNMGVASRIYLPDRNGIFRNKEFVEVSVANKELWLKGSPDAVIINLEDGLPYILELKSIKQELFLRLEQPSWDYIAQVNLYMYLTKIPRAIVVYENKNDQDTREFSLMMDPTIIDTLLKKIREIQQYVLNYETTKELPPKCNSKWCIVCKE